jgi:hypothetical protein
LQIGLQSKEDYALSLIRKAFWPAAIALGLLVFLGAIGQSGTVKSASAFSGDICLIEGPSIIAVGDTVLYVARTEDDDESDDYNVSLDDIIGDSDITSILPGNEGDLEDYETINPTDNVVNLDDVEAEWMDSNTISFLESHFGANWKFDADVCGQDFRDVLTKAIDLGEAVAGGASCDNVGFGDSDIDCELSSGEQTAVVNAVQAMISAGEVDDCDDLGDAAEAAAIEAGAAQDEGAQVNDFVDDWCEEQDACDDIGDGWDGDEACVFDDLVIVDVTCYAAGNFEITFFSESESDDSMTKEVKCLGPASSNSTLTASPASVEIVPAPGNVSRALITATLIDSGGNQAAAASDVDFTTTRCSVESAGVDTVAEYNAAKALFDALNMNVWSTATNIEASIIPQPDSSRTQDAMAPIDLGGSSPKTVAATVLMCDPQAAPNAAPGDALITAIIDVVNGNDIIKTVTVKVVGPPASISVQASPSTVRCGEKATITATIKDAIGNNVSEHTRVEAVTNNGGTLAGTGAVANQAGLVSPLSSTVGETFSGVATFFLLTSEQHSGPYEVVVTSGGSGALGSALGGVFSTPPVSAQVTVTCTIPTVAPAAPAPTVKAPSTGTGGITPPNTGDGGLVETSNGTSWTLFAVAGAFALTLAAGLVLRRKES